MKSFRLVTLLGIRPDIIRMFKLIKLLDRGQKEHGYEHIFMHTGQHFDFELDSIFYRQLGVKRPKYNLNVGRTLKERGGPTSHSYQTALLFERTEEMLKRFRPDAVMYLGDTNSVISSFIVARAGIPVVHLEAGGRSFDWRMPEEKCRIVIDHMADLLYSYMPRYRENLLREGIPSDRIVVIGNIIYDAVQQFLPRANKSTILRKLKIRPKEYCAVTLHREENTSTPSVLRKKVKGLLRLNKKIPIVWPLMPRVRKNLETFGLWPQVEKSGIKITKPLGFFEFLKLEKEARLIVSDSGTVQEEALILGVPCLITRRSTERPETISAGATILDDRDIYANALKALRLPVTWDRFALNPTRQSPSEIVYQDLIKRMNDGWLKTSRSYRNISSDPYVQQAYGRL